MGTIHFAYTDPNVSGTDTPTTGSLRARLFQREVVTGKFRTIATETIVLVNGAADAVLSNTGVNQCWVVQELIPIPGRKTFYKKVTGDANFVDLVDVDPLSFQPIVAGSTIAAEIADLQAQIDAIGPGGGAGSPIGIDTDGVPYFDPAISNGAPVQADTDGVPYFA